MISSGFAFFLDSIQESEFFSFNRFESYLMEKIEAKFVGLKVWQIAGGSQGFREESEIRFIQQLPAMLLRRFFLAD